MITSQIATPSWRLLVALMLDASPFLGLLAWEWFHARP
jgi:hypothetical protein